MDSEKIAQLIKLLKEHDLSEIELSEGDQSIRIKRQFMLAKDATQGVIPVTSSSPKAGIKKEGHQVCAPMVGTFYSAPGPNKPPFVTVGKRVEKGDPLCIIEAMKMMNQVDSEWSGVIKEILVENGKPVEFHQQLFVIE